MYACIYHINITIRVTVQTTNIFFEQTKNRKSLILRGMS